MLTTQHLVLRILTFSCSRKVVGGKYKQQKQLQVLHDSKGSLIHEVEGTNAYLKDEMRDESRTSLGSAAGGTTEGGVGELYGT